MNSKRSTWDQDAPLVIGHRGASLRAPENTLAAFRLADELGADGVEMDIKLTKDRVPIVMHDSTLERTTNGSGRVRQTTYADIAALDAGAWFSDAYSGERVPTLTEVLESTPRGLLLNLELTNYDSPRDELPEVVLREVRAANAQERVLFSSFNPIALWRLRRLEASLRLGFLFMPATPRWLKWATALALSVDFYHPQRDLVTPEAMRRWTRRGLRVNVWTVNDPERARALIEMGAAGLITDDAALWKALK